MGGSGGDGKGREWRGRKGSGGEGYWRGGERANFTGGILMRELALTYLTKGPCSGSSVGSPQTKAFHWGLS